MSKQRGFTIIELIVVIIILGILAATALPKFINLKEDAAAAAVKAAAGALTEAAALNYAAAQLGNANSVAVSTTGACNALTTQMTLWDASKFSVVATANNGGDCSTPTAGQTTSCVIQSQDVTTKTAAATVICTS